MQLQKCIKSMVTAWKVVRYVPDVAIIPFIFMRICGARNSAPRINAHDWVQENLETSKFVTQVPIGV